MARKGYKVSDETKRKISLANKGKKRTPEQLARMSLVSTGRKHTPETKAKMAEAARRRDLSTFIEGGKRTRFQKGQPSSEKQKAAARAYNASRIGPMNGKHHTEETRRKITQALIGNQYSLGRRESESTRLKKRLARLGKKNPAWIDGRTYMAYTREFQERIRYEIKRRDNYICQDCGKPEPELTAPLNVHHVDTDRQNNDHANLVSLCDSCHRKRHTAINRARKLAQSPIPS